MHREDIQRLAPALTTFMTSDSFIRSLITTAVDKANSQQGLQTAGRRPAPVPSGESSATTSACQSHELDGTSQVPPRSTATTQLHLGPSSSAARQSLEVTFKAGQVKMLFKTLQSTATVRPSVQAD